MCCYLIFVNLIKKNCANNLIISFQNTSNKNSNTKILLFEREMGIIYSCFEERILGNIYSKKTTNDLNITNKNFKLELKILKRLLDLLFY